MENDITIHHQTPAIDDPMWVRARYDEAKALIVDLREYLTEMGCVADPDLNKRIEEFYEVTFMDTCTTLGPDCGCNAKSPRGEG